MRIALFVTCLADTMFPQAAKATVLLLETPAHATVEIECSGAARDIAAELLESLPIPLEKNSGGSQ